MMTAGRDDIRPLEGNCCRSRALTTKDTREATGKKHEGITSSAAVLLAVAMSTAVAGCSETDNRTLRTAGGLDATKGAIILDDVSGTTPTEFRAGKVPHWRLYVDNESTDDALLGVTSDTVSSASLRMDGRLVSRIDLPAQKAVNLEWGQGTGAQLEHFRRTIRPGQWFSITLSFAKSAEITMLVTAGPLDTEPSTTPSQTATAAGS
jgi:hypothetical protein